MVGSGQRRAGSLFYVMGLRRCDVETGRWQWTAESRKIVVKFENTRINSLGEMNNARASPTQSCGIVYVTSPSWGRTDESLGWTGVRLSIIIDVFGQGKGAANCRF